MVTANSIGLLSVGDEFQVNTYTTSYQRDPSVAALTDGSFVIVWGSMTYDLNWGENGPISQDGSGDGVYGQRFDASGTALGDEFQVNTYTNNNQHSPSVTALSDGGYVVTWMSVAQDGSGFGIYGQRYATNGDAVGSEFQINTHTAVNQWEPSLTGLSDGGFVVCWQSDGQDGNGQGIFGQRYDANGAASGAEFQINTYATGDQTHAGIVALDDGGFVVCWQSDGQDGDGLGIFGQRYDANGATVGTEFRINTYTQDAQSSPSISSLSDGGFVVAWVSLGQDGDFAGIFGQRYDSSGAATGDEFQINTYATGEQVSPGVTSLSDGGFVVAWASRSGSFIDDLNVYGQRFDAAGDMIGPEFQINTNTTGYLSAPVVTELSNGDLAVAWHYIRTSNGIDMGDVFAQIVGVNALPSGTVTIHGTASDGETLSVSHSLADADGLGDITFHWSRNGVDTGIAADTYSLSQTDVGATITVEAVYLDGNGTEERIASDPTAEISNTNDLPQGAVVISGDAVEDVTLSASDDLTDADGLGTITFHWLRDGSDTGVTGESYTLTQADVGAVFTVRAEYTDGFGAQETVTSTQTAPVSNVNDAPTGSLVITGDTIVGSTVTADTYTIQDEDGLGAFSYQWLRNLAPISGATSESYLLSEMDEGANLSVLVRYTDGFAVNETLISTPVLITDAPLTLSGTNGNDTLNGGFADDFLDGLAGNDRLEGFVGNDSLYGRDGQDTLIGGDGNDILIGGDTDEDLRDVIYGGEGNDSIDGGYGNDELRGDDGNDTIEGGFGVDTVIGGGGDDALSGSAWSDLIFGGTGNDFINGGYGYDRLNGGTGADRFFHLGVADHGADWIQDYRSSDGDVLQFGADSSGDQFQVNFAETPAAGIAGIEEAFIIYRPTGQILWALIDGGAQTEINLLVNGTVYDLLG